MLVFNGVNQADGQGGGRRDARYDALGNDVVVSGGVKLPHLEHPRSVGVEGGSIVSEEIGFAYIDRGKAGGTAPVQHCFGAEATDGLPVAVIEVGMQGFGQAEILGLLLLQSG